MKLFGHKFLQEDHIAFVTTNIVCSLDLIHSVHTVYLETWIYMQSSTLCICNI